MVPNQPKRLTQEEVQKIMALPKRSFRVSGELKTGRYDEETRKFYELTTDGKLTGKVASVPLPSTPTAKRAGVESSGGPDDEDADAKDKDKNPNEEAEDAPKDNSGGKKKPKKALIIGGAVAGVLLLCVIAMFTGGGEGEVTPPDSSVPPATDPAVEEVHVVQVTKDLLPGHVLTPDDVQDCVLDAATYNEAVLYGRNLCSYDTLDELVGNYVAVYVPAMQYLEQDAVQAASPFEFNPWGGDVAGTSFITVPIPADIAENQSFGFGSTVEITIHRVTENLVAVGGEDPSHIGDVPGVTHTSTVGTTSRTDEFTIGSLYVCDLLNADGASIYEPYCAYMGIPLGSRLGYLTAALKTDENLWNSLIPAYAVIRVTDVQAVAIGDVNGENTTVTLKSTGNYYINDNAQSKYVSEAGSVKSALYQAKAINDEEKAKEAEELQKVAQEMQEQNQTEG